MRYFFLSVLLLTTVLNAVEFHVDKKQNNQVKFTSDAPLEEIVGVTNKIDGYVMGESDDMTSNSEFYFEVDLASLDTGIGLRNRHMRDEYLETDKYPFASYGGTLTSAVQNADGSISIKSRGTFKLHGVEKKIELDGLLVKTEQGYKASSQFSVKLEDYKIERPQLMMMKIGDTIELDVQFYTTKVQE